MCLICFYRAEAIKKKISPNTPAQPRQPANPSNKPVTQSGKPVPPLGFGAFSGGDDGDDDQGSRSQGPKVDNKPRSQPNSTGPVNVGSGSYTKEEIEVLRY